MLTVSCRDCVHPVNKRQIVQWRENCRECCDDLIARHLAEFPDHRLELSGRISSTPFGVSKSVRGLFCGEQVSVDLEGDAA